MHKLLEYPFDPEMILQKKKRIKRELLEEQVQRDVKKIAILGGTTTSEIKDILELFLLNYGISPLFYESEYGLYWEEAVFENEFLEQWHPDIIFIHTCNRNIKNFSKVDCTLEDVENIIEEEYDRFETMWIHLAEKYKCVVIQNNFEMPLYRLFGNQDGCNIHGQLYMINELNRLFSEYAANNDRFYIHDINYLSASYGLNKWFNLKHWYMYKYAMSVNAIPFFSYSLANIIKSIYGKNKKVLMLDLDNTLWGGIIGEEGVENIEIGEETAVGQAYRDFQQYVKKLSELGVVLAVNSKNDEENALCGLSHPMGVLKETDFAVIMANWENKNVNTEYISEALDLTPDSFVFIDDNPAERELVKNNIQGIAVPEITQIENAIQLIDGAGYFEKTYVSKEDMLRNKMYKNRTKRFQEKKKVGNYEEYLKSLNMHAIIECFKDIYINRITQLINKSNQFNLTTKRYTETEIQRLSIQEDTICLYGSLSDKFGDEGIVSVVIGRVIQNVLEIDLWLMSCRVLKRGFENAMMDSLIEKAKERNVEWVKGFYKKTNKNAMVKEFYALFGFEKTLDQENGNSEWLLKVSDYKKTNENIMVGDRE